MEQEEQKSNGSKSKINKNLDIKATLPGAKQKIKINGLFGLNKEVLDDPDAEEMKNKGMYYVVATIDQENNTLILWDMQADGLNKSNKICEIDIGFGNDEITCLIKGNDEKLYIGGRDGSLKTVNLSNIQRL